jgi:hypothetical protein
MSAAKARPVIRRNENSAARSCADRTTVRAIVCVMQAARSLWGRGGEDPEKKPDIELASRTGAGLRSCQYMLASRKGLSADGFARLLVSDAGPRVFRELAPHIDDATLDAFEREIKLARNRSRRAALDRELESLVKS